MKISRGMIECLTLLTSFNWFFVTKKLVASMTEDIQSNLFIQETVTLLTIYWVNYDQQKVEWLGTRLVDEIKTSGNKIQ